MILVVNWFEIQLIWLSTDLRFKWFGCQSMCASNDFGCLLIWTSSDSVVNWSEIQVIRLSIDLRFKWFGCQLIWDSNELVVNWFEIQVIWMSNDEVQVIWLSTDVWFKWFCQTKLFCETSFKNEALKIKHEAFLRDFLQNWSFEAQKRSNSARLPSKLKLWSSKTKLFCETSFKIEVLKPKNEAFLRDLLQNWKTFEIQKRNISARLPSKMKFKSETFLRDFLQKWIFEDQKRSFSARCPSKTKLWNSKTKHFWDFLQNWSVEGQKRSFSARLPSKTKLWSSKTKLFCETSFKNEAFKLQNEAFLRDFLQKWSFEAQKRSFSARLPSKMKLSSSKTKHFCETSFKNEALKLKNEAFCETSFKNGMSTRHLTSELQYVLAIFNRTLQKYCACHEKVEPRYTNSCNCNAKRCLQSNTSVTWTQREIIAPATRNASFQTLLKSPTPANVFATLTNSCACHVFCNVSKSLRLPRETHFEPQKTSRDRQFLTILTSKSLSRAGVVQFLRSWTSKSAPNLSVFNDFDFQIALARRRGAIFAKLNFQKCSGPASF